MLLECLLYVWQLPQNLIGLAYLCYCRDRALVTKQRGAVFYATSHVKGGVTLGRYVFIAVDNKIDIRRDNGEMENRCDAILHDSDHIIFVELKNQAGNWINHAITQLATTIDVFKSVHDITMFRQRLAYACNKRRPAFAVSHKEDMQRFKNKYGVRLIISCEITVK